MKADINYALLACPFCGGQAVFSGSDRQFHEDASIRCQKCGVVVLGGGTGEAAEDSVEMKWNRRDVLESQARNWDKLTKTPEVRAIIQAYTAEVNRRAEQKMLLTGKLAASHHAAMREINQELNI